MNTNRLPRSNKFQLCAVALALVGAVNAYAANPVTGLNFDQSAVTSKNGEVAGSATTNIFNIDKYSGPDVLTGASFTATLAPDTITFANLSTSLAKVANAHSSATLNLLGVVTQTISSSSTSDVNLAKGTSGTEIIASYSLTGTASAAQLSSFYSTTGGMASGSLAESTYVNVTNNGGNSKDGVLANAATHAATVTATYTSVKHANGSFASASDTNTFTLNFNTVDNNTAPSNQTFNLYNLLGSYGLDVKGYTYTVSSGGSNPFTLNLIGGSSVSGGSSGSFAAGTVGMLAQTVAGDYSGTWDITVADSVSGDGAGKNTVSTDVLHLTVLAHVNAAPVTSVPEPESYAMLLAGLGLMGTIVIRRRGKDNA